MAISRAQLVKELEPGLNALFGLEYDQYGREYEDIFNMENSDRALAQRQRRLKEPPSLMMTLKKSTLPVILWRLSHLHSPSPKRQSKIIFMIDWLVGTHGLWREA